MVAGPVFKLDIRGDKAILRRLRDLPKNMEKKVLQRAAREAMKPALPVARKIAPKGKTGNLRRSLRSKTLKRNRTGRVGQQIITSDKWFKGEAYYGAFQEFGWHIGKRAASLRRRRKWFGIGTAADTRKEVPGKHFVEETYDSQKSGIASRFISLVKRYIVSGLPQDRRGAHLKSSGGTQ